MSNLAKIRGVTGPVLVLFGAAGFRSAVDVAELSVEEIVERLREANAEGQIVRRLPGIADVKAWRRAARKIANVDKTAKAYALALEEASDWEVEELRTARVVSVAELKKAGIAVSAVPIAKLFDGEGRPGATRAPAPAKGRAPAGGTEAASAKFAEPPAERPPAEKPVSEMRFRPLEDVPQPPSRKKRRNPGMSHHSPVTVWVAAGAAVVAEITFVVGLLGTLGIYSLIRFGSVTVPKVALATPALIPIALLIFAILATKARCRLCGQRVFVPKKCLKHVKADRSIFGYVFASAIRALVLRNFRCMFCGTKIRLSKKSMRQQASTPEGGSPPQS